MKPLLFLLICCVFAVSCTLTDASEKTQTVITNDSSNASGRLYVDVMNSGGSSTVSGAKVSLFISLEDMKRNYPLYSFTSSSSGTVDFGYILNGNYYITGASGLTADTTVAQILPRRTIRRYLFLH